MQPLAISCRPARAARSDKRPRPLTAISPENREICDPCHSGWQSSAIHVAYPDERETQVLRSKIERYPFSALLGVASMYALVTSLGVILMADALTRVPVLWPHIIP